MPRYNKYNNRKTFCFSRHKHDSGAEANYCNRLLAQKQKGEIYDFKTQWPVSLDVNGQHITIHVVDFCVFTSESNYILKQWEAHEVKGYRKPEWELKMALFKALFPETPYRVIEKGSKIWTRKKKTISRSQLAQMKSRSKRSRKIVKTGKDM